MIMTRKTAKPQTFEDAAGQLEKIVQELDSDGLPLEKAMEKFEEGIRLSKFCSEKLDETEKKIMILLRDPEGNISEKPFLPEDE